MARSSPTIVDDPVQVLDPETSEEMLEIMQAVTESGSTGYYARHPPDTTWLVRPVRRRWRTRPANSTTASARFAGLIPAEDPQIAIAVVVYNGNDPGYGSSETAAPVFGEFGAFAVRHLGIPPSTTPLVQYPWTETELNYAEGEGLLTEGGTYREYTDR